MFTDKQKQYQKEYYQKHKEKRNATSISHYYKNIVRCRAYHRKNYWLKRNYYLTNRKRNYLLKRDEIVAAKIDCFKEYRNGIAACVCCGEKEILFLTLDHIFNDGKVARTSDGKVVRNSFHWLKRKGLGFPNKDRLQTLCMNCNFGKRMTGGDCPHRIKVCQKLSAPKTQSVKSVSPAPPIG